MSMLKPKAEFYFFMTIIIFLLTGEGEEKKSELEMFIPKAVLL